jgi:hypothetical protein
VEGDEPVEPRACRGARLRAVVGGRLRRERIERLLVPRVAAMVPGSTSEALSFVLNS